MRIHRQDLKPESYLTICVCSDHFVTGIPAKLYDTTHQDWVPSLNLGYNTEISDSGERCAKVRDVIGRGQVQKLILRVTPQKMQRAKKYRLQLPTVT